MSLGLLGVSSLLIAGISFSSYLISHQKTKNRGGVLLLVDPKKKSPSTTISNQFLNFHTDQNFSKVVNGDYQDWEEDGGGQYGPAYKDEENGKSYYYGFFFEDSNTISTQCTELKDKEKITIYVGKQESSNFENTKELQKLNKSIQCPRENYGDTGELFSGNRKNSQVFKFEDPIFYIF